MEELVDIFDIDEKLTGVVTTKLAAHQNGLWHASAHIWIYNANGEVLLQKRSTTKDTFPGMWDISVAGHIDAGETPLEGALREMREEIGVVKDEKDFEYYTTIHMEY
ncbi:MAG: NUDIX domain-containing protein, partial [Flavobacteriales bacterium]|nr:NUDIX domain-containing protein [Flavobacteriales bacterium]